MNIFIPMLGLTPHGGNRVLVAIANSLVNAGYQCTIVCPVHEPSLPFALDPRVCVHKIGPRIDNKVLRWLYFVAHSAISLRGKNVLANHFLTAFAAQLAGGRRSRRTVYLVQDIEYKFYPGVIRAVAEKVCRFTYVLPNLLPANRYLEKELRGFGLRCLQPVDLGIAASFFAPRTSTKREFDIVYFLRREHHKRLDRFEAILALLSKRNISVVGVSQDEDLLAMFRSRLAAVHRPEGDAELIGILDSAKVLLLTSDQEGFSLPPLEAMARGIPTVMFPCGGPTVYARHGENAEIVEEGTPEAAAAAIEKLLATPEYYATLSRNALCTAQEFSFDKGLSKLIPRLHGIWQSAGGERSHTDTETVA